MSISADSRSLSSNIEVFFRLDPSNPFLRPFPPTIYGQNSKKLKKSTDIPLFTILRSFSLNIYSFFSKLDPLNTLTGPWI